MSESPYIGSHRAPKRRPSAIVVANLPKALSPAFLMPTTAASALILTTTGAAMAGSAPLKLPVDTTTSAIAAEQAEHADAAAANVAAAYTKPVAINQVAAARDATATVARAQTRQALSTMLKEEVKKKEAADAAAKAEALGHTWVLPMTGNYHFSSPFGPRNGRLHAGIDLSVPVGTPVSSVSQGEVIYAGYSGTCGKKIVIKHWNGIETQYCHLSRLGVAEGDSVMPGTQIGLSGNTGRSTGPHLHFEVHLEPGVPSNPIPWLKSVGLSL